MLSLRPPKNRTIVSMFVCLNWHPTAGKRTILSNRSHPIPMLCPSGWQNCPKHDKTMAICFSRNPKNDTSVDPKQPVYFEIKKPPWVSVVWVVIACRICSKHDPCICSKQCNVALSASIAPVAAKSCKRSCQTSAPVLRPSVHSALRPKCYLRPQAQSSAPAFTAP